MKQVEFQEGTPAVQYDEARHGFRQKDPSVSHWIYQLSVSVCELNKPLSHLKRERDAPVTVGDLANTRSRELLALTVFPKRSQRISIPNVIFSTG